MTKIIEFEYCALVIEVLIFVSVYLRGMVRGRVNRWFIALNSIITLATATDIWSMILESHGVTDIIWNFIANTFCVWASSVTMTVFCGYLFAQTGMWRKIGNKTILKILFYLPLAVETIGIFVVNPFTKLFFYIGADGIYVRGPLILITYFVAAIYSVISTIVLIKCCKMFSGYKIFCMFTVFGATLVATVIQYIFPLIIIQNFFTACAVLAILLGVQAPEERMHALTGLFSMNAYVQDIKKLETINAHFGVALSVMTNRAALIDMLGYFSVQDLNKEIGLRLMALSKKLGLRDIDHYYLGGGRFAVIIDEKYEDRMLQIFQEINGELTRDFIINEMQIKAMNNVCAIRFPEDIDDTEFLFAFDEKLLQESYSGELRYAEKLFDRNTFELHRDINAVIDRGLSEGSFSLHFQPVFSHSEGRYVSAEAFLRINDKEFGYISPNELISEAEKNSSIHGITTFVIEEVCKFVSQPDFLLLGIDFIEINLSPVQCLWSDLLVVLLSTLRTYNVQTKRICFNIRDVDNSEVYARMRDNLDAMSQLGFKVYMDDFGAGIFEIERIATMPLVGIKLDREFVKNGLNDDNLCVFKGTLRMIKDIGIDVVAVGVENEEMADTLLELGCDNLQGFYYTEPLSKNDLMKFLLLR